MVAWLGTGLVLLETGTRQGRRGWACQVLELREGTITGAAFYKVPHRQK